VGFKSFLKEKGFEYSESTDSYRKSKGFGRFITVEKIFLNLFRIKNEQTVEYDNFIDSFDHFKQIINKTIENE